MPRGSGEPRPTKVAGTRQDGAPDLVVPARVPAGPIQRTLVGRDAELAHLHRLIADVRDGARRAASLVGPPGSGKTSLVRWAADAARAASLLTALVRAPAAAALPPRFPVGELLAGVLVALEARRVAPPAELVRIVDTLTGSAADYPAALPHIVRAIEAAARVSPLALLIDDLQHVPPDGLALLLGALRAADAPLLLVTSGRDATAVEPTADLWVDRVDVRALGEDATALLAAAELGRPLLPSAARALHGRTVGNPLFVVETLRAWRDEGAFVAIGGHLGLSEEAEGTPPRTLRDMIEARLVRGGEEWTSVAGTLAVLGRPATFGELVELTGIAADRLVEIVGALADAGIVADEHAARFRLAHPVHEAIVLDAVGAARRAHLHGRILERLRARGSSPTELAHHAIAAPTPPSDLPELIAAAAQRAEAAWSYEEAARWYGSLAALDVAVETRARALLGQARATEHSDPVRALALYTDALALVDAPADRARALVGRAGAARKAGRYDDALRDLEAALPDSAPEDAFAVRHAVAVLHAIRGRRDEAEALLRALADETRGSADHVKAVGHLSHVWFTQGRVVEARDLCREAEASCGDAAYRAYLRANLGWMQTLLGEWADAERLLTAAIAEAEAAGDVWNADSLLASAGYLYAWKGDLDRALDLGARAVRHARRLGNPAALVSALDSLMVALVEQGHARDATRAFAEAAPLIAEDLEPRELSLTYVVAGEAHLLAGDLAAAQRLVEQAREHLAHAACWAIAVDRLDAQLRLAREEPVAAVAALRPWLARPSALAFEQARAVEVVAHALLRTGERGGAIALGADALARYTRLGAAARERRAREWLQRRQPRPRGRPRSTLPHGLTGRELEILALVAEGRSNADIASTLFLSTGTVKKHVERILAKTGRARRGELALYASEAGLLERR